MENIPDDTYTAVARQWDHGFTKGKPGEDPKPQIVVQFEVTEGPYAGHCVTWFGFFTEKTQVRTLESLRFCGWKSDDVVTLEGMGSLLVQIAVEQEENAGKTYSKVRWVNRMGGGFIKLERPMDMTQKRMFAAQMKIHARMVPIVQGGYAAHAEAPKDRSQTEVPDGSKDLPLPF